MPQAQIVSIKKIRADIVVAWRGLAVLVLIPSLCLGGLIVAISRDLPRGDLAPLRSPMLWLVVALIVAGQFAARRGYARLAGPNLWIVIIVSGLVVVDGLVGVVCIIDPTGLAHKSVGAVLIVAALVTVIPVALYWLWLKPTVAALRLLATRVPPDGTPLPTVLASPLPRGDADDRAAPFKKRSPAAVAYRAAAVALGIVGVVLFFLSVMALQEPVTAVAAMLLPVLIVAGSYSVRVLWRRGR